MKRAAIPQEEAVYWARRAAESHWSRNIPALRLHGLVTWSPKPWDAYVAYTDRLYYFWIYVLDWCSPDAVLEEFGDPSLLGAPEVFAVGTYAKGGHPVGGHEDVEVYEFDTLEEAIEDTKPTTWVHLRKSGLSDIEILSVLGS